jgi:NADPH-dependent ferric siderophore reductase
MIDTERGTMTEDSMTEHRITRVRHELVRRRLAVREVARVTPHMLRITLEGEELAGFTSASPDDHVKIFVPGAQGEIERRDYTPRHYDAEAGTLAIDFALHDAGPATQWALQAKAGDVVEIGGPRGSTLIPWSFDWYLLVGDETALPAIGRRIEEAPAGVRIISVIAVTGPEERQAFETKAEHDAIWVYRPAALADGPGVMLAALAEFQFPAGEGFIWIAAEAKVAKVLRQEIETSRGHLRQWMKASGYWTKGVADAADKLGD